MNPLKVKAIQKMLPPQTWKEAQTMTGRIVALSRFVLRLVERILHFFNVLWRNAAFEWTSDCQSAFEQLKELLSTLPLLKQPVAGQPLFVYLAVRDESLSSVLVRKEMQDHYLVSFMSKILHGVEIRYSEVEKAVSVLVMSAWRLWPYFLNHVICPNILSSFLYVRES